VGKREQEHGWHGHFLGFRARLNCEDIPVVPASLVRCYLDDPRRIPYLLVWKDERFGGIKETVRLARYADPYGPNAASDHVELKRTDGTATILRIVWRMLPRNGGCTLLLNCFQCGIPRRHVYAWEWDSHSGWSNRVRQVAWQCRSCARLRYSSEGGYLCHGVKANRSFSAMGFPPLGNLPRPVQWYPYVFTDPDEATRWLREQ
jgi:hypothetical protein